MDGHRFEYYCANLLRNNGFTNVTVTKGSGDQGVDVVATIDGVRCAFQCKYYSKKVGNSAVQQVVAGKNMYGCQKAIVITNNLFTPSAKELAKANGVLLWDATVLRKLQNGAKRNESQSSRTKPTVPKSKIKLTETKSENQNSVKPTVEKSETRPAESRSSRKFMNVKTFVVFAVLLFVMSLFGNSEESTDEKGRENDVGKADILETAVVKPEMSEPVETETPEVKVTIDNVVYEIIGDYAEVIGVTDTGKESATLSVSESVNGHIVSSIREKAFYQCKVLESVTIPDSISEIGERAFYECRNLKSASISQNITAIQYETFAMCNSLEHMEVPEGVTIIGQGAFRNCGFYTLSLPSTLLSIESDAFFSCYNLESIVIPNSVTNIGKRAFKNARSLSNITLSDSLVEIGDSAFWGCTSLTTMTVPPSIQELDSSLFVYDENLKTLYIPKSCKIQSGDRPFAGCWNVRVIRY